ncbi:MAG: ABC-F family ATP-binding cassette domain-containing protein [Flavobacteriaceae bacterium]
MLSAQDISVSFGGTTLFESLSFRIGGGDRVGLVGKNGAGKSTLLKLIAQEQRPTTGDFALEKNCSIGYLAQDIDFEQGRTVLEESYQAFAELIALEKKQEQITGALLEREDYESEAYAALLVQQAEAGERYELLGGYTYQAKVERVLKGLGFLETDFERPTETFSGGWRMRIELAKLLLKDHDILLLDEPTNHLDIDSIVWLEQFLNKYKGAVVLVSHDKMFLDQVTNRTMEIIQRQLYDFKKPYSKYLEVRAELREKQLAAQKNQEKKIQQTEQLIERFRAKASKASMAQSLIKRLDKMDRIEIDPEETEAMKLHFPVSKQPGKVVIETEALSKSYGDHHVLSEVDLLIERGRKIAFVGQNGQGKSTLAKILVGELRSKGHLQLGHNVELGYFAQDQSQQLDGSLTVLDAALDSATEENRKSVRDVLGAFLFRGEDVDKKVAVLSGGERNRLALCKLLLQPFNVLVMDEPTNHLDLQSKSVLKEALRKFEGTLLLVSHDRDFLQDLCDSVFEFKNQKVKEYLGGVADYLEYKKLGSLKELEQGKPEKKEKGTTTGNNYQNQKQRKKIQNKLSNVEKEIKGLEKWIKDKDLALEINYDQTIQEADFFDTYHGHKKSLETLYEQWEQLEEQLDTLG